MDQKLLAILACPLCKGRLEFQHQQKELICRFDKLAFPIREEIPIMLVDEARKIQGEES